MGDSLVLAAEGAAEKISFYQFQDVLSEVDKSIKLLDDEKKNIKKMLKELSLNM